MLRSMSDLKGYAISATDGTIGRVKDFYFDDESWSIRYLIVETGNWLFNRKVLISPIRVDHENWSSKKLPVFLTKERIKNSPDIDTKIPVSRQHEILTLKYYSYPNFWGLSGFWGNGVYPGMLNTDNFSLTSSDEQQKTEEAYERDEMSRHKNDDIHLRSFNEVVNYHIMATDGEIGHVQGMLVDDETWAIRYLIVDTSNWRLGHKVLISPKSIKEVSWFDAKVYINLTKQAVKNTPSYDSTLTSTGHIIKAT
jgi:sporulation protein YlmC with PRC-barrel domain